MANRPVVLMPTRSIYSLAILAGCLGLVASPSYAQDPSNLPVGDSGAPTGVYVPGAPVPEDTSSESGDAAAGKKSGKRGGKIGKITKVDRDERARRDAAARAMDRSSLPTKEIYSGIVPGIRDWHLLPRRARDAARKSARKRNRLSWIGFQNDGGQSTIFVQTIKEAPFRVAKGKDKDGKPTVVVTLLGTRVPIYNNRRTLDTSYFPSAVVGAHATPRGRNIEVTISLQSDTTYDVRQSGEFIFVDFSDAGATPYADQLEEADGSN